MRDGSYLSDKYHIITGVVLPKSNYMGSESEKDQLLEELKQIKRKNVLAEVIYKNPLAYGNLSALDGFTHLGNDLSSNKIRLIDPSFAQRNGDFVDGQLIQVPL